MRGVNVKLPRKHKNLGKYSQSRVQCFSTAKWFNDKEGITVKYNAGERLRTAPAGYTKKSKMDSRRKHNAQRPRWRLFLLYCYYCSTVLKSEWQWPEPFQTTERRSIFVMRKWKWWRRRSLTLTVSCAMKEQWSAPGNYGVGKQWHHRHKTNQGTSSKCTKMCINQIYAINPGLIPILKPRKIGPNSSAKKGESKGPYMKFKSLKRYSEPEIVFKISSSYRV